MAKIKLPENLVACYCFDPARENCPYFTILVPRAHDPSGLWQGSRALVGPDFLSMRRAFVSYSRPIRFDAKSVNRGLPVLDQARALDPCHRPEGSWALETRMIFHLRTFATARL